MTEKNESSNLRPCTSPLMAGSGRVVTASYPCAERIELYLNLNDLTHIVTHRTKPLYKVEETLAEVNDSRTDNGKNAADDETLLTSPKPPPPSASAPMTSQVSSSTSFSSSSSASITTAKFSANLPKTYMTRSGPLLLFSENSIPRGKLSSGKVCITRVDTDMSIQGQQISPRNTDEQDGFQRWGKLINKRPDPTKVSSTRQILQSTRDRIPRQRRPTYRRSYDNKPVQITRLAHNSESLHDFSDAVLSYSPMPQSHYDRYVTAIKDAWVPKTATPTSVSNSAAEQFSRLSTWTKTWLRSQEGEISWENLPYLGNRRKRTKPKPKWHNECLLLEQARVYLSEVKIDPAPVNTPLQGVRRTWGLKSDTVPT